MAFAALSRELQARGAGFELCFFGYMGREVIKKWNYSRSRMIRSEVHSEHRERVGEYFLS